MRKLWSPQNSDSLSQWTRSFQLLWLIAVAEPRTIFKLVIWLFSDLLIRAPDNGLKYASMKERSPIKFDSRASLHTSKSPNDSRKRAPFTFYFWRLSKVIKTSIRLLFDFYDAPCSIFRGRGGYPVGKIFFLWFLSIFDRAARWWVKFLSFTFKVSPFSTSFFTFLYRTYIDSKHAYYEWLKLGKLCYSEMLQIIFPSGSIGN